MDLRKILCVMAVSTVTAIIGLSADVSSFVHAKDAQFFDLDEILKREYILYLKKDYAGMCALEKTDMFKNCVQQILISGCDRYICDIDGTTKAMLYVASEKDYYWYFGQTENHLRHGTGTTIQFAESKTYVSFYTGKYFMDNPYNVELREKILNFCLLHFEQFLSSRGRLLAPQTLP